MAENKTKTTRAGGDEVAKKGKRETTKGSEEHRPHTYHRGSSGGSRQGNAGQENEGEGSFGNR